MGLGVPVRLAVAGASGLLLVGGITGVVVVDGGAEERTASEVAVPGDTTLPAGPGALAEVPPAVATTVSPATTPTSVAPTTAAPAAATTTTAPRAGRSSRPGPLVAPRPGAYGYEATSTSAGGTRTDRTTTTVEAAGTEGGSTIQVVTIPLDLGGQQATARNTVAWSAQGAVVRRSLITVTGFGQLDCAWQPPFAQYAGGLAVGARWSFTTRCATKLQGFDVTLEQRATRRVTGSASVAGPAGPVATWTIADDTTFVVTSPLGTGTARTIGTQQLAPSLGLPVRSQARIETAMPGSAPERSSVTTKLVSLP